MNHISLLENGGTVLVVGGYNKAWQSFRSNPRVVFWTGEQKEVARQVREKSVPTNCKAVIISRFLSHSELGFILQDARRRRLALFANKTDGEVTEILEDMLSFEKDEVQVAPPVAAQEIPVETPQPEREIDTPMANKSRGGDTSKERGKLLPLIEFVDWKKSNAENARALMASAVKELQIKTTVDSLSQFIMKSRKKLGFEGAKRSPSTAVKTEKKLRVKKTVISEDDIFVKKIDEIIETLTDIRTLYAETVAENTRLKSEHEKIAPLITAFKAAMK